MPRVTFPTQGFCFIFGGATETSWHFSNQFHLVENAPNESHDVRKARTNVLLVQPLISIVLDARV